MYLITHMGRKGIKMGLFIQEIGILYTLSVQINLNFCHFR
jgi:hypothetical protein